ncbi:MAG TPA: glycosyltransferase [Aromatoleum sp.]|uniref:glycosyltransferase n=1 Tax=Aromatoleum sp. TaxID=2307007 RepID=UPI002B495403|nr:glycosyltransferase [Aromatoleum sp.]HJV26689.1 glycosyltransferase [Aromatoleum sp.]
MPNSFKKLYRERRQPYYITAPNYSRASAGIRVMHRLCHALNLAGEEAWITCPETDPSLNTPLLTMSVRREHEAAGLRPIAVYPEVIAENPLDCPVVVRYILNVPGLLGQRPAYRDSDLFYVHTDELAQHLDRCNGLLFLPTTDASIFNNFDNPFDNDRHGACIYFGRYEEGKKIWKDLADNCTVITKEFPATHPELADLFRRSERLYCFENTTLHLEARLCGCPVVLLPSPFIDLDKPFGGQLGFNVGLARSNDEQALDEARRSVGEVAKVYEALEEKFWTQLEAFVEFTQEQARNSKAASLTGTGLPVASSSVKARTEDLPLFDRRRPYYIVADDYTRVDSRVRAMHQLCHALNLAGAEAYMVCGRTAPELRTPPLTLAIEEQHRSAGVVPIHVYADDVAGNPLAGESVVRYAVRAALEAVPGELLFAAAPDLLPADATEDQLLFVPIVDRYRFSSDGATGERPRVLAYTGGFPDAHKLYAGLLSQCEEITRSHPATQDELVKVLRQADRLYCFGESNLALEAALCGCPVVYVQAPGQRPHPGGFFAYGDQGLAFDDNEDALHQARETVGQIRTQYIDLANRFPQQLSNFIRQTQQLTIRPRPENVHISEPESVFSHWRRWRFAAPNIEGSNYEQWRSNKIVREIDAELFAERMMRKWPSRPRFHFALELRAGEESLLADTLDALDCQLYQDWQFTIVAPFAAPDPEFLNLPHIQWVTVDSADQVTAAMQRAFKQTDSDWIAVLEPGVRLEPHALLVYGDYIATHPSWLFVYSDDDVVNPNGELTTPRFKPDLNLDLLRSMHYLGSLCIVRRQALLQAGGLGEDRGAEVYDIALRILDNFGVSTIGHIAEVVYHSPALSMREIAVESERTALANHLARCGVTARIVDGHGFATRRVLYTPNDEPKVSIVILSTNKAEFLAPCLDSIQSLSIYSNLEILLIDGGNTDPDSTSLLASLAAGPTKFPVTILDLSQLPNLAARYNAAAKAAKGDYLVFLDDDTVILQEDWIDRLLNIATRPEVGIAAPRLGYPGSGRIRDTGQVLGLGGSAAPAWDNLLEPDEPGYQGLATVDRNVSAVSPACFMVRAKLFHELAGFDEKDYPQDYAILDFCLRLRDTKHWIVWTPYATVAHYNSGSRHVAPSGNARFTQLAAREQENENLLRKWLPTLANDPFYNRNLSLSTPYQPDAQFTVPWDVNFHERRRLLGFPLTGGSGEYRVIAPFRALSQAGLAQTCVIEPVGHQIRIPSLTELVRAEPDVIVMHQAITPLHLEALERYRKYRPNILRVTGLDDLISLLPAKHPRYRQRSIDVRPRLRACLDLCDRAVVSTEPLAELCRPLIDDVVVMPNCLEWDIWGKLEPVHAPGEKPRVGWIGAQQHYGDLEHIFPVVEELADEVDWIFMGMCPPEIRPFVKEAHGWTHGLSAYAYKMSTLNLDLAIAPLDQNPFNEAKSNLRLLEYGAMGWPVVCTDIYPYQDAPATRVPNRAKAWINAIREILSDRDAARAQGQQLRQWVENDFILEKRLPDWLDALVKAK